MNRKTNKLSQNKKSSLVSNNLPKNKYKISKPNEPILIHQGGFSIRSISKTVYLKGSISFNWIPNNEICFSGEGIIRDSEVGERFEEEAILYINDRKFFSVIISDLRDEIHNEKEIIVNISGVSVSSAFLGKTDEKVEKITFLIPNFNSYLGDIIREIDNKGRRSRLGRIILENDDFLITIDQSANYKTEMNDLKKQGGYHCMHVGELVHKHKLIKLTETDEILKALTSFLSFVNGRRTAPLFLEGFKNGENIFTAFCTPKIDIYNDVFSWMPQKIFKELNSPWNTFYKLWTKDKDTEDVLFTVVHWYVEANKNSGFYQGELVMATTALELLFNWWMVSIKKKFKEKEIDCLHGKIRELLNEINLDTTVPDTFKNLQRYTQDKVDKPKDGPKVISELRNKLMHAREGNRTKHREMPCPARYEALKLSLWYIEVTLLSVLEYKHKYRDRTSSSIWRGQNESHLPNPNE